MKAKGKLLSVALFAAVWVIVFVFDMLPDWYGDILLYRFSFVDGHPVTGIGDIITSQIAHYADVNGRMWVHVLCQFFAGIGGKILFSVCNALVYVFFVWIFTKYSCGASPSLLHYFTAALVVLFFCDTCYTPNCQIGYIWTSTLVVTFLYALRRVSVVDNSAGLWSMVAMAAVAFFAGAGNEAISLGIAGALCIELALGWRKYSLSQKILMACFALGTIVLCAAPSNFNRESTFYRPGLIVMLYNLVCSLRAFYLLIVLLAVSVWTKRITIRKFYLENRLLINAAVIMLAFNLVIGLKTNRQLFCVELASAIMSLKLLSLYRRPYLFIGVFSAAVVAIYAYKAVVIKEFNHDVSNLHTQLHSNRGDVFIDLPHFNNLVHPIEYMSYKDQINLFFHVASQIDDIDNRGRFYVRTHIDGWHEPYDGVRLYPEAMRQVLKGDVKNQWMCRDGVYLLLRDKKNPARFMLHRELALPFVHIPLPPYEVVFDNAYGLDTDDYQVMVTSFPVPMMRPLDIEIQEITDARSTSEAAVENIISSEQ